MHMPKIHQYMINATLHEMLYTYFFVLQKKSREGYVSFSFRKNKTNLIQAQLDSVFQEDKVVCNINVYKKAVHYC